MDLANGKKGMFYTIIAITLLLALIFAASLSYQFKYREQRAIVETRVNTMDSFIKDLDDDIEKGVKVAGYRSLLGMTNYVIGSMSFLDDAEQRFEELFYDGTIYGQESFVMINNTFINWTQKMGAQANLIGLNVSFTSNSFNVQHTSPWYVQITTNVSAVVTDAKGVATWRKSYAVETAVSIEGFEDPAYTIKTGNGVTKMINRTIYDGNYVTGNDTTNLGKHMNQTLYTAFEGSPSFLMRFEGDFNESEYGIESLVNKQEVDMYYPCPAGTSNVDSLYWQCSSVSTWNVRDMPSWFYIDNQTADAQTRHEKYEVTNVLT